VITGVNNKLGPLRAPNLLQILKTATPEELARGVREINLADLRQPRTAIYLVMSEDNVREYLILLELFFGLAAIELQHSTGKNVTPVLFALDEAGNMKPPKLEERLKVGRFRNTPYLLGFQDVNQVKAKWGENAGRAILAGLRNQIFLPGIDPDTGAYASSLLGSTTVLSRTEVDATGTQNDAERVSESRRDLRQAPELRRMVKYRQGIAIIDTADPILFRFPKRADNGDVAAAPRRSPSPAPYLAESVAAMNEIRQEEERQKQPTEVASPEQAEAALPESPTADPSAANSKEATKPTSDSTIVGRIQIRDIEEKRDQKVLPFVKTSAETEDE
jgi:type IV secretory pathway TraG/TraD family ATPase VirD4